MSDFYSGSDLFSEFDRLQRQMANLFGTFPSSLRASRFGAFPPVNIGATDDSIEIVAFAPGVNAAELDVSIDKGLLTISGERKPAQPDTSEDTRLYAQERFMGEFRGDRAAGECRSRQGSGALREWLSVDRYRQARILEASRDHRPVTRGAENERYH
jgi:HSP20 family protein